MYFDGSKFDYDKFERDNSYKLIERDKASFKYALTTWIKDNIDVICDRKWEIDNIGLIEQSSEFTKLIKEAELTYSLGAYFSTISLIGISCEGLCKFIAEKHGIEKSNNFTQNKRINALYSKKLITEEIKDNLHSIRILRNNCLHFNDEFRVSSTDDLKKEAINCLNTVKGLYKDLCSATNTQRKYNDFFYTLIKEFADQQVEGGAFGDTLNQTELSMKNRSLMYQQLGIDIAPFIPEDDITFRDVYTIDEIDLTPPEEVTLINTLGGIVYVDLSKQDINKIKRLKLKESHKIIARITSKVAIPGSTENFYFSSFKKYPRKLDR